LVEELGITVAVERPLVPVTHHYSFFTVTLHPFVCTILSGEITLHEHAALLWLPPEALPSLDWAEADLPLIDDYVASRRHFQRLPKSCGNLRKTAFTQFLVTQNDLDKVGFRTWVFYPGMLFNAPDRWWGDGGKRAKPHEGLDLCLYRDGRNRIVPLREKTKIPATYDGTIMKIFADFLGQSVIIDHDTGVVNHANSRLCTIYGHLIPEPDLYVGKAVTEGETIGTIAKAGTSANGLLSHLHLSFAWKSESLSYDRLDWDNIGTSDTLTLVDPLELLI
jgi:hypothetical protein